MFPAVFTPMFSRSAGKFLCLLVLTLPLLSGCTSQDGYTSSKYAFHWKGEPQPIDQLLKTAKLRAAAEAKYSVTPIRNWL